MKEEKIRATQLKMLPSSGSSSKISSQIEDFSVEPDLPDPLSAEDISEDLNSLKSSIGLDEVQHFFMKGFLEFAPKILLALQKFLAFS